MQQDNVFLSLVRYRERKYVSEVNSFIEVLRTLKPSHAQLIVRALHALPPVPAHTDEHTGASIAETRQKIKNMFGRTYAGMEIGDTLIALRSYDVVQENNNRFVITPVGQEVLEVISEYACADATYWGSLLRIEGQDSLPQARYVFGRRFRKPCLVHTV